MAVIGSIVETATIEGADRIQQAVVVCGASGKWTCVVGKDMAVGDTVTVFLQDAVLPPDPRWAFMEKHHWRVRMARFKGVPSECVIIPGAPDMPAGTDLTEALGVTKYEKPIPAAMSGDAVGAFPSFIPKTDEPNFQTVPEMVAAKRLKRGFYMYCRECDNRARREAPKRKAGARPRQWTAGVGAAANAGARDPADGSPSFPALHTPQALPQPFTAERTAGLIRGFWQPLPGVQSRAWGESPPPPASARSFGCDGPTHPAWVQDRNRPYGRRAERPSQHQMD